MEEIVRTWIKRAAVVKVRVTEIKWIGFVKNQRKKWPIQRGW